MCASSALRTLPRGISGKGKALGMRCRADIPEDVLLARAQLERGAPFCGNPACALHVRLLDAAVEGGGNWITLPDGRIFGRNRFGDILLCDACGTRRGPVRIAAPRLTS
jgi:hypothetical protein